MYTCAHLLDFEQVSCRIFPTFCDRSDPSPLPPSPFLPLLPPLPLSSLHSPFHFLLNATKTISMDLPSNSHHPSSASSLQPEQGQRNRKNKKTQKPRPKRNEIYLETRREPKNGYKGEWHESKKDCGKMQVRVRRKQDATDRRKGR
ncbi:hypothetical protein BDY24DRAFT_223470 [Mrakia frigida]|uniref:uncharacterized protein n=1 Tax=Mrakia frigida TaxID=29902 RepID=UPI003FCC04A9